MPIEIDGPVFVTAIEHRHGTNFYINRTEEGASKALYQYVIGEWEDEDIHLTTNPDTDAPFGGWGQYDESTAIAIYFEHVDTEYWVLGQATVEE